MALEQEKNTDRPPQAPQPDSPSDQPGPRPIEVSAKIRAQAQTFFERAAKVAHSGNHDYAVQMYLEGLRKSPDELQAHQELLEQALRRQAAGGKKAGLMATLRLKLTGKASSSLFGKAAPANPVDELLRAEEVWSKDPQNLSLADIVLQKMMTARCLESAKWLAAWLGEFNARAAKDVNRFSTLADVFAQLGQPDKAVDACRAASAVKPQDAQLAAKLKNMLAQQTMRKGKYDDREGFRQSLKEGEDQDRIHQSESITRRQNVADERIAQARKELDENPQEAGKIAALVEALLLKDNAQAETEAIELLEKAHQQSGSYRFKQRASEIRMRANRRQARHLQAKLQADPQNAQLAEQYRQMRKEHLEVELAHFQDSAKNYPTDMRLRYELGRRLLQLGRFDQAIPALQEGQRDPRNHLRAMSLLGQCFYKKKWFSDAIDLYKRALDTPDATVGDIGKELQYNLGRAYEADHQSDQAIKTYSAVAQIDFLYKDVRQRIEQLRTRLKNKENSQ